MKIKNFLWVLIAVASFLNLTSAYADEINKDIVVRDPWVQAMPLSQTTTAAYMTIINNSTQDILITSVSCEMAQSTEIHQMSDMNGMMKMKMLTDLKIPAHDKVELSPSGFHLMLINLKKPVNKEGDMVSLVLHFQNGTKLLVNAPIKMQKADHLSDMAGMKM